MKMNPHQFYCKNYCYSTNKTMSVNGINLTQQKVFVDGEDTVVGEKNYDKYVNECTELFRSIFIDCDFWVRVGKKIYINDVENHFHTAYYTILQLITIMNGIASVQSYKREKHEKYLLYTCVKTVESRLTSLEGLLAAIECRKFLVEETDFDWETWAKV